MKLIISIADQSAELFDDDDTRIRRYRISTAANGAGERNGSYCTPRGKHIVRAKIGAGMPINTVFVKRRPTGEVFSEDLRSEAPGRDWILTRILWLSGCELNFNRMGPVDTMRRYIYIHGTPETTVLGAPGSHGCVRMGNRDVVELFDLMPAYTPVEIIEGHL